MPYYNTIKETKGLKEKEEYTKKQDKTIFKMFVEFKTLGASDIFKMWHNKDTPITSIRRSLNTLMNKGKIIKTETKQDSYYKSKEYVYKINEK